MTLANGGFQACGAGDQLSVALGEAMDGRQALYVTLLTRSP